VSDRQPTPFEYEKWSHELKLRAAERAHDNANAFSSDTNSAAIDGANLAMRTAVLINGGAAVSVLAFIGGLASQGKLTLGPKLTEIATTLLWFASGVAAATLCMGLAYFTNYCIAAHSSLMLRQYEHPYLAETGTSRAWKHAAITFQVLAIIGTFGSLGLFIYGMFEVKNAISHLGPV
jgi:hypothetical protein